MCVASRTRIVHMDSVSYVRKLYFHFLPPFREQSSSSLCFSPKTRETEFNFGDHRVDPPRTRTYEARMTWMAMVGSATGGSNGGGGGGGGVVVVVGE